MPESAQRTLTLFLAESYNTSMVTVKAEESFLVNMSVSGSFESINDIAPFIQECSSKRGSVWTPDSHEITNIHKTYRSRPSPSTPEYTPPFIN